MSPTTLTRHGYVRIHSPGTPPPRPSFRCKKTAVFTLWQLGSWTLFLSSSYTLLTNNRSIVWLNRVSAFGVGEGVILSAVGYMSYFTNTPKKILLAVTSVGSAAAGILALTIR